MSSAIDQSESRSDAAKRWVKESVAHESLVNALKTFAWLCPLTLLIWVWAERSQVVAVDNFTIPFEIQADNRFVRLEVPKDPNVIARLRGPNSRINELKQRIVPVNGQPTVRISVDPKLSPGHYDIDAALLISGSPVFQSTGVSVIDCVPKQLTVFVDQYEERQLEVRKPANVTNLSSANFVPAKVTVRAPKSYFDEAVKRLKPGEELGIEADLAVTGVLDKPGQHSAQNVRVSCRQLPDDNVTYSPSTVKSDLEVRQFDDTTTFLSIIVEVQGPGDFMKQYQVKYTDTIANVTVKGPADKISQMKNGEIPKPIGVLRLTLLDRPAAGSSKPGTQNHIKFDGLPDGVTVVDADKITVNYTVEDRAAQP